MRTSEPENEKYKNVHDGFPNLAILTKSVTSDEVQLTFTYAPFRNKSLGDSVVKFSFAGSLHSPSIF